MSIPSEPVPSGPIQDQIVFWNEVAGHQWVARQESQDVTLAPIGEAALERAGIQPGESIIDIGCGCGGTTVELARRVGQAGRVLGIDVSQPMLARARERTQAMANVALVEADATTHRFEAGRTDLLFSRLGVMFFADPPKAFANLRSSLKPGGRMAFACFRAPQLNPFFTTALRAATEFVPPPPKMAPGEAGPFAFAEEAHVRRILDTAGFKDVKLEPIDLTLDAGSGKGLEEAVINAREIGPSARVLRGQPADLVAKATDAIRKAYGAVEMNGRIPLDAAIWVVTARNG
jgi:ubiquinone/menaquinone biosynthesis C-methylase UbiE